jgi:hypothetical protein
VTEWRHIRGVDLIEHFHVTQNFVEFSRELDFRFIAQTQARKHRDALDFSAGQLHVNFLTYGQMNANAPSNTPAVFKDGFYLQ